MNKKILLLTVLAIVLLITHRIVTKEIVSNELSSYNVRSENITLTDDNGDDFDFKYYQIEGKGNSELTEKINSTLRDASTEWINKHSSWVVNLNDEITYKGCDYLSITYKACFKYSQSFNERCVNIGIIVDMKSGERTFLNDFYEDISEFENKIPDIDSYENVDSIFDNASLSELQYLSAIKKEDPLAFKYTLTYLSKKPIVYIRNGLLVIDDGDENTNEIMLDY